MDPREKTTFVFAANKEEIIRRADDTYNEHTAYTCTTRRRRRRRVLCCMMRVRSSVRVLRSAGNHLTGLWRATNNRRNLGGLVRDIRTELSVHTCVIGARNYSHARGHIN